MILRILKSNQPVNYFLVVLFGLATWSASLIKPQSYSFFIGEDKNILFAPIRNLFKDYALVENITTLVLLIFLALFIQHLSSRFAFIRVRTMLPATLYVLLVGGFTKIHTLHSVYFASAFLLFAIHRLFSAFDIKKPYSAAFDSGFWLGVGSLFYFDLIFLFPAFIIGIAILSRETGWRSLTIHLVGFLLPFIFAISYAVLTDQFPALLKIFEQNLLTPNTHFKSNIVLQLYLGFLIILTILGSILIIQQYDTKKVSSRKFFMVFFILFVFSLAGFVFVPSISQEVLIILAIPVCYLVSNFLVSIRSKFWGELIISLLLGIVIFMQILAF